jgi:hypothetical protein
MAEKIDHCGDRSPGSSTLKIEAQDRKTWDGIDEHFQKMLDTAIIELNCGNNVEVQVSSGENSLWLRFTGQHQEKKQIVGGAIWPSVRLSKKATWALIRTLQAAKKNWLNHSKIDD